MNCTKCGCNKGEKCNPKTRECEKNESILDSNSRRERQIIFVQPVNGENISQAGGIRSITVEIKKQDGKNEEVEKMPATLIVDGSLQNIELHRLEKGLYTAALEREIPVGTHALHLALHDDWNSNKTIHTTISKAADLTWFFAGMILLIIAISGTIELKNHIKEKNTKKEKQRFEIAKRRIMLKNLKLEFYKRHITEKEYRKEALRIQAEIKELQKNKKNKSHIKTPGRKVK